MVFQWFKNFNEGRTNLEDEYRSGRRSTINNYNIIEYVVAKLHSSSRETSNVLNVSKSSIVQILGEKNFKNSYDRRIPHELKKAQMDRGVAASKILTRRLAYNEFLKQIVTTE